MNPDLIEERAKSNFNQPDLEEFLMGKEAKKDIALMADFIGRHPELTDGFEYYQMDRVSKMESWWKKYHALMKDDKASKFFMTNSSMLIQRFAWSWCYAGLSTLHLHQSMFT